MARRGRQSLKGGRDRETDRGEEEEEGWQINNSLRRKTAGVKFELLDFVSKAIYKKKGQTQVRIFSVLHRSFKRADPIFFEETARSETSA